MKELRNAWRQDGKGSLRFDSSDGHGDAIFTAMHTDPIDFAKDESSVKIHEERTDYDMNDLYPLSA